MTEKKTTMKKLRSMGFYILLALIIARSKWIAGKVQPTKSTPSS